MVTSNDIINLPLEVSCLIKPFHLATLAQPAGQVECAKTFESQKPSHLKQASCSVGTWRLAWPYAANRDEEHTASAMGIICTIGFCDNLSRWA
jgi:hypothetical protein